MNRTIWMFVVLNTVGGIGHHVDHIFRHKEGWPLKPEVTGWTFALLIYVGIAIGAVYSRRGVLGPGFWALYSFAGFIFTAVVHFAPGSPDPPALYAGQYGSRVYGAMAITWLVLLLVSLGTTTVYCGRRWLALRRAAPMPSVAQ